jgi:hypothetical protein
MAPRICIAHTGSSHRINRKQGRGGESHKFGLLTAVRGPTGKKKEPKISASHWYVLEKMNHD